MLQSLWASALCACASRMRTTSCLLCARHGRGADRQWRLSVLTGVQVRTIHGVSIAAEPDTCSIEMPPSKALTADTNLIR